MRTCFRSSFRLVAGRPDLLTPGQWVFMPPGTPHFPGGHWLGSRDWTTEERAVWPDLGELPGDVRTYSNGGPPGPIPPAVLLGSLACLENGERFPLPVVNRDFATGWDSRCYPAGFFPPPGGGVHVDIRQLPHQQLLAGVLTQLYVDPTAAGAQLQAWMGPGTTITIEPGVGSIYPGSIIGVRGNTTVVILTGTANFFTAAIQGFVSGLGPQPFGVISTSPLWWSASTAIIARITAAGGDPTGPIIFAGHSYGGATAAIVAARILYYNPSRPVQVLTFGMPPPGDCSIAALLSAAVVIHYVNDGDAVPYLPPGLFMLGLLGGLVGLTLARNWRRWCQIDNLTRLTATGQILYGPDPAIFYTLVLQAVTQYLLLQPITPFAAHSMAVYAQRLGAVIPPEVDVLPGTVVPWAGPALPAGYLNCDGAAVSRATYSALFAAVGTSWGPGDGFSTFNLPDLRGRAVIGVGTGPGLSTRTLAQVGGEEDHVLSVAELATHAHPLADPGHLHQLQAVGLIPGPTGGGVGTLPQPVINGITQPALTGATVLDAGSDSAHNNMPPWAALYWLIKT